MTRGRPSPLLHNGNAGRVWNPLLLPFGLGTRVPHPTLIDAGIGTTQRIRATRDPERALGIAPMLALGDGVQKRNTTVSFHDAPP